MGSLGVDGLLLCAGSLQNKNYVITTAQSQSAQVASFIANGCQFQYLCDFIVNM
jgi:hypothetical protein